MLLKNIYAYFFLKGTISSLFCTCICRYWQSRCAETLLSIWCNLSTFLNLRVFPTVCMMHYIFKLQKQGETERLGFFEYHFTSCSEKI